MRNERHDPVIDGTSVPCLKQLSCQVWHPQMVEFAGVEIETRLMFQVALVAMLQGGALASALRTGKASGRALDTLTCR